MIIDVILDRKCGCDYTPSALIRYTDEGVYGTDFRYILEAFWTGRNSAVQDALCRYIDTQGYNPEIKDYVKLENWL